MVATIEQRHKLLKIISEMGLPSEKRLMISAPMRGMTDEQKEQYAEKMIQELKGREA